MNMSQNNCDKNTKIERNYWQQGAGDGRRSYYDICLICRAR